MSQAMRRSLALALLASLAVACRPSGPRDIALGQEQCAFCRMTITDAKFAAEVRTARGRLEAFDSPEARITKKSPTAAAPIAA